MRFFLAKKISFATLLFRIVLPFFIFSSICFTFSQEIRSQNAVKSNSTIFSLSYLQEDKKLLKEEVLLNEFRSMPETGSFGINNGIYWFKLIINKTKETHNLITYIPTHNIDAIDVYQLNGASLNYISSTGNSIARDKLPIDFKFPAFKVNANEVNDNIYFLKVNFPKEANFPIKIINEKVFLNYVLDKKAINSFYYGTCMIIILLNLFFFIKFRESTYLYYFFLLASLMMIFLFYDGSLIQLFRGNEFYYKLELLVHISTLIWFLLFSIKFLNLEKRILHFTNYFYLFPFLVLFFYIRFLYTNNYTFIAIADTIGISAFPVLWLFGIHYLKIIPAAKFYVLGYLLMVPLAVFFIICYPFGLWKVDGDMLIVKIAGWLDIIVFTYAISYRMKTKIINGDLSIKQLKEAIESTQLKLLQKSEIVNPYLVFLEENTISTQPLSLREVDVLKYLNEGSSNKEISEKLFISSNTVKTHIRNIYTKLNINNRLDVKAKIKHLNT